MDGGREECNKLSFGMGSVISCMLKHSERFLCGDFACRPALPPLLPS